MPAQKLKHLRPRGKQLSLAALMLSLGIVQYQVTLA